MSNADEARQWKLIRALRRHGYPTDVFAFSRSNYYRTDESSGPDVEVLGALTHESYLTRVPVYLRSLRRLRRGLAGIDVVVAYSSEHVLLARGATLFGRSRPAVVREFGDVPGSVDGTGWRPALARWIERWGLRHSRAIFVTADEFVQGYLRRSMGYRGPVVLLPNKSDLPERPDLSWKPPGEGEPLEILYPGLLRCRRSLKILLALADAEPTGVSVSVCGHNLMGTAIPERDNFRFLGPFRSPEDLERLHASCHVVYAGYPYHPDRTNYPLARTVRFNDAVTFGRPQISHVGTADAIEVERHELGIVIDPAEVESATRGIAAVPRSAWGRYAENARRLARRWPTYDDHLVAALPVLHEVAERR